MKKETKKEKIHRKMCYAIMDYMESIGGKALVVGEVRIRQRLPLKYNFTIEIDFTGRSPKNC